MIDMMVELVRQPAVLWTIVAGAVFAVTVESLRTSPGALWGELVGDESEE